MNDDEPFTPERVDEQVDQLSSPAHDESSLLNARVVQRLHALYEEDQRSTARVWERLARQVEVSDSATQQTTADDHEARHAAPLHGLPQEETQQVHQRARRSTPRTIAWLATIAAVLCTALLVSSLLWVLQSIHSSQTGISTNPSAGIYLNETDSIARLDSQTHKVIWHTTIAGRSQFDVRWAPTVLGKVVYTYSGRSLQALNAQTGALLWSRTFKDYIIAAPTLANGQLYVITSDSTFTCYALNPTTGAIIITTPLPMIPRSWAIGPQSPVVWHGVLYYTDPIHLYAVQLPGAKPLWQRQALPTLPPPITDRPIPPLQELGPLSIINGVVYVTTRPVDAPRSLFAFDARTGQQIWRSPALGNSFLFLAVTNTMIYVINQVDEIHAFDVHTHRLVWQRSLVGELNCVCDVAADANSLYVRSDNYSSNNQERVAFIALNAANGQIRWQQQYSFFSTSIQENILGTYAGTLYIDAWNGTKGIFSALDPSNGSIRWQMPIGDGQTQWGITIVAPAGPPV
jgi:outer membrane protein assembly factor BamB